MFDISRFMSAVPLQNEDGSLGGQRKMKKTGSLTPPESGRMMDMLTGGGSGGGGLLGALQDVSKGDQPMMIQPPQIYGNPVRDAAMQSIRGFRYGGILGDNEIGVVGEDAPEIIRKRPDGQVEIMPMPDVEKLLAIGQAAKEGRRYVPPAYTPQEQGVINTPEQFGLDQTEGEGGGRVAMPTGSITETVADAPEIAPPPRKSVMDVKRWLTKDPYGSGSDAVWQAREDVATSDLYDKMNAPVKESKWKDLGMRLLTAVNNSLNNRNDPIRGWGEIKRDEAIAKTAPQLTMAQKVLEQRRAMADRDLKRKYDETRIKDIEFDNQEKTLDRQRKIDDRVARERTARMTQVAGILKNIPEFIPGDPKFKELEDALGDVGLPVTQKDAKKKVDLKQDQRTGAWTVILTNPATGQQEVRPVMKDGQQLKTTPTVVMQGEYGMLKQNDQQAYQADENAKNRAQQRDLFLKGYEERVQRERRSNIFKAQDELQKLNKDLQEGAIDLDTYNAMVAILNAGLK